MSGTNYTQIYCEPFKLPWWRLILRFRHWRYERRMWREWNALPADARAEVDVMRRRIEAGFLLGGDSL